MVRKVKHINLFVLSILLFATLVAPVALLIVDWLSHTEKSILFAFLNKSRVLLIGKSLFMAGLSALFATFSGGVCSFLLYKLNFKGNQFYRIALVLPLLISPYIFAVAWNDGLRMVMGNNAAIYCDAGVVLVHTLVFFPLTMIIIGSALSQINATYEESGLMMVSFRKMLVRILLPLVKPAIIISFLLVMIFSLSDFSVPAFFGVQTFTTEIFTQFSALYNFPLAIGQSVLLLVISFTLMLSEVKYLSDSPFLSVSLKGSESKRYSISKGKTILHIVFLVFLIISLMLPVLLLVIQSFAGNIPYFMKAWQLIASTIGYSLSLAFTGSFIITLSGLWIAYTAEIHKRKLPNNLLMMIFVVPSTVLGISLIRYYNNPSLNFIYGSVFIIILAYLGRFGFIASRIIANGLKQIPDTFREAASLMGVHPIKVFFKITVPLLIPSLFAAFILSFILCLGELGVVIMVYPPGAELMNIKLFTVSANAPLALTSTMTLINLALTGLLMVLFFFTGKVLLKKSRNASY
jgi:ABC-type Fe3+ transport system permease subunit